MAKKPAPATTPEAQQQDPYLVIRNLQSACKELEEQNNWLRTRAAENAVRADRAIEYAQHLEKKLEEASSETEPFVPAEGEAPAPRAKKRA